MKIYANYGILSHENEPLYTVQPVESAALSEQVNVLFPDGYEAFKNHAEETMLRYPDGNVYALADVLTNDGDAPALVNVGPFHGRPIRLPLE